MIKVIQMGLGAIGRGSAKLVLGKKSMQLVGAIDPHPNVAGKRLSEILCDERAGDLVVSSNLSEVLAETEVDVCIHCTGSRLIQIRPQLEELARAGISVVSSSEELFCPDKDEHWQALDRLFRDQQRVCTGAGINPGFVMDLWPSTATAICQEVTSVRVVRVQDAGARREQLQRKVGAGQSVAEVEALVSEGKLGHVGLEASLRFLMENLGLASNDIRHEIKPVIAQKDMETEFLTVKAGQASGLREVIAAYQGERAIVSLELELSVGAQNPREEVSIEGNPSFQVIIPGGLHGDITTCATLVNTVPRLIGAKSGVLTLAELPTPSIAI